MIPEDAVEAIEHTSFHLTYRLFNVLPYNGGRAGQYEVETTKFEGALAGILLKTKNGHFQALFAFHLHNLEGMEMNLVAGLVSRCEIYTCLLAKRERI